MKTYIVIGVLIILAVIVLFILAACRLSGICSDAEEQEELKRKVKEMEDSDK